MLCSVLQCPFDLALEEGPGLEPLLRQGCECRWQRAHSKSASIYYCRGQTEKSCFCGLPRMALPYPRWIAPQNRCFGIFRGSVLPKMSMHSIIPATRSMRWPRRAQVSAGTAIARSRFRQRLVQARGSEAAHRVDPEPSKISSNSSSTRCDRGARKVDSAPVGAKPCLR